MMLPTCVPIRLPEYPIVCAGACVWWWATCSGPHATQLHVGGGSPAACRVRWSTRPPQDA